jgi:hypothetical protein
LLCLEGDVQPHIPSATMLDDIEKKGVSVIMTERLSSPSSSSSHYVKRQRSAPRAPAPNFFKSPKAWFKYELWSWRFYTWTYAALAFIVWLIHLFALIAVAAKHPFDANGRSTLYEGSCDQVVRTSRYVHWFISLFGMGYLSASAYVMVGLSSRISYPFANISSTA